MLPGVHFALWNCLTTSLILFLSKIIWIAQDKHQFLLSDFAAGCKQRANRPLSGHLGKNWKSMHVDADDLALSDSFPSCNKKPLCHSVPWIKSLTVVFPSCLLHRLLRMLHQMFRRRAVRLAGGHHPLLLRGGPVLRMRPRGSHRHRHHPGDPLLPGDQRPRHADRRVSALPLVSPLFVIWNGQKTFCDFFFFKCFLKLGLL